MAHVRKQIREAVKTKVTGLTTTGSNVFETRIYNLKPSNLPALLVSTPDETSFVGTFPTPRPLERIVEINLDAFAKGTANLEDTLDLISEEVETALMTDITLGGLTKDLFLKSTKSDLSGEGKQPIGIVKMVFECRYMTTETTPGTAI